MEPGDSWQTYNTKKPAYTAWSHYASGSEWAQKTQTDLRSWGFNTLGGWSENSLLNKSSSEVRLPYTVVLHLGAYHRAPWDDLFSDEAYRAIDGAAKSQIDPIKNDPNLIGYFTDNELGWWDDTIFLNYVKLLPENSAGRKKAHELIRDHYGTFENFKKDWILSSKSWEQFDRSPDLKLRPGGSGMEVVNKWTRTIGDHYYKTVHDAIRRYDQNHLILGDRYCQYFNFEIARASKPYIDVASTNLGADWTDGTNSPFQLETLHYITGKPILITEFYMCATENRSGNKNTSANFPVVQTQAERAVSFKRNIEELAKLPYVVGAHWFQMHDEPMFGRGDGEDYNMGLIDIFGKPYSLMTSVPKSINIKTLHSSPRKEFTGPIPIVSFDPMVRPTLKSWPRLASLIKSETQESFADMYVVQDKEALYVGLIAMDYLDLGLYENNSLPESERSRFDVVINGESVCGIRFGGDKKKGAPMMASCDNAKISVKEIPGLKHTLFIRIPWTMIKNPTEKLALTANLASHSRAETMRWSSTLLRK